MGKTSLKHSENKPKVITTGISLPTDLFEAAKVKIATDQELDFSKYVRRLIRADLQKEAA